MKTTLLAIVAAVALVTAALPTAALPLDSDPAVGTQQPAATNASVAPGEAFAGAIGVQRHELDGAVETRAFGLTIAAANTDNARAAVLANRTPALEQRLERLQERQRALIRAHENGSITDGRFRAEMAQEAARIQTVQRLANQSQSTARELPEPARQRHGVNVTAIEHLRERAHTMAGPEVARMARGIAGPSLDRPMGRGPPAGIPGNVSDRGPGMGPGNASDMGPKGPMTATNRTDRSGR